MCGQPCSAVGKHPKDKGWQKTQPLPYANLVRKFTARDNIGIVTGNDIVVLDVDTKGDRDGEGSLAALELQHGKLPPTFTVKTGTGFHYYFRTNKPVKSSAGRLGDGLDVRGEGGFAILPPSKHLVGNEYEIYNDAPLADAPEWLDVRSVVIKDSTDSGVDVIEGGRNTHLTSLGGTMRRRGMSHRAIEAALIEENLTRCKPPLDETEVRTIAASVSSYKPESKPWKDKLHGKPGKDGLMVYEKSVANAVLFLTHSDIFAGALRLNLRNRRIKLTKDLPRSIFDEYLPPVGEYLDETKAWLYFQDQLRVLGLDTSDLTIQEALPLAAQKNSYDPLLDWLEGLVWDGESRLDTWITTYCKPVGSESYANEVGKRLILAAVERALEPGCKVDVMTIIEGRQGIGKSRLVRLLASSDYFQDGPLNLDNRETPLLIQNAWFYEVGELEGIRKASVTKLKGFLSKSEDTVRRPYARKEELLLRRTVFVGTTNEGEYLTDTENRRFLPLHLESIDLDGIEKVRDQLFAEAVHRYRHTSERHYTYNAEFEEGRKAATEMKRSTDPWTAPIADFIDAYMRSEPSYPFIKSQDLVAVIFGSDVSKASSWSYKRIKTIMEVLGWEKGRHKDNPQRGYKKVKP